MPPVGFEPTISADERPHTYALDRAAAGTGEIKIYPNKIWYIYTCSVNVAVLARVVNV